MLKGLLTWRGAKWEAPMLVDTGSDFTVLPLGVAEVLGLEMSSPAVPIKAAGSRFEAHRSEVYLQIEDRDTNGRKGNPFLLSPILVPAKAGILDDPVLGREPLLEGFELTVRQYKREFVLRSIE